MFRKFLPGIISLLSSQLGAVESYVIIKSILISISRVIITQFRYPVANTLPAPTRQFDSVESYVIIKSILIPISSVIITQFRYRVTNTHPARKGPEHFVSVCNAVVIGRC